VIVSVKVKAPKATKRKIALTSSVIGPASGSDFAIAVVLGAGGGTLGVPPIAPGQPGAALSGSSVVVPPGALPSATPIVVATAPNLAFPDTSTAVGPAVFFGPEGTHFDSTNSATRATITIPFNLAYASLKDTLVIYTRDAKGKVTAVPPPYTFDTVNGLVTVNVSHFSSFSIAAPAGQVGQFDVITAETVADPQDVCVAIDLSGSGLPILYYVAEGTDKKVGAITLAATTTPFARELWAGGGTSSVDGTTRLQFKFVDPVQAVTSSNSGETWIATTTQIFHVDDQGAVTLFAGDGQSADVDGAPLQASFKSIGALLVDSQNNDDVYVADVGAHKIRLITGQPLQVSTFAGSGVAGPGADGGILAQTKFEGPYHNGHRAQRRSLRRRRFARAPDQGHRRDFRSRTRRSRATRRDRRVRAATAALRRRRSSSPCAAWSACSTSSIRNSRCSSWPTQATTRSARSTSPAAW